MKIISSLLMMGLSFGILASENYVDFKSACRRGVIERSKMSHLKFFSPIERNDLAETLVDDPHLLINNLKVMEEQSLLKASAQEMPWSDTYWPLSKGGLGQRYADEEMMMMEFKEALSYVELRPAEKLIAEGRWNELSPAEKYDSLMGLDHYPLTKVSWAEGKEYLDEYGKVESWMGLCHGWAAVSIMMPEPKRSLEIPTPKGPKLFYPSDIKGLGTLLWAKGDFETRFIGGRCNSKNPNEDNQDRSVEKDCLDNNPGTWHQVVVNQIGVTKRPFIMDANYSYEVWNHPVFSYEYKYFHPKTRKSVTTLSEAVAERNSFDDKRSKFRARETKYIVGVKMRVTYLVENQPSHDEDQPKLTSVVDYHYDLELNRNFEIIGGEWYSSEHPDFLWIPVQGTFPVTQGDQGQIEFNFFELSDQFKKLASFNARYGLPWGPVVRYLFEESSKSH